MTPDKLEALRKLAADDRTPIEEARNAALQFVRHGGAITQRQITLEDVRKFADVAMVREAFGPELDALKAEETQKRSRLQKQIDERDKDRDALRAERDALKKQLEGLRGHGKALLEFVNNVPEVPKKEPPVHNWNPIMGFPYKPF